MTSHEQIDSFRKSLLCLGRTKGLCNLEAERAKKKKRQGPEIGNALEEKKIAQDICRKENQTLRR